MDRRNKRLEWDDFEAVRRRCPLVRGGGRAGQHPARPAARPRGGARGPDRRGHREHGPHRGQDDRGRPLPAAARGRPRRRRSACSAWTCASGSSRPATPIGRTLRVARRRAAGGRRRGAARVDVRPVARQPRLPPDHHLRPPLRPPPEPADPRPRRLARELPRSRSTRRTWRCASTTSSRGGEEDDFGLVNVDEVNQERRPVHRRDRHGGHARSRSSRSWSAGSW